METYNVTLTEKEFKALQKKRERAAQNAPTFEKCQAQANELRRLKSENSRAEQRAINGMGPSELSKYLSGKIAAEKRRQKRIQNIP